MLNRSFLAGCLILAIGIATATSPEAVAQTCNARWLPGMGLPGLDGGVCATVNWDPDGPGPQPELLVVGGSFSIAGNILAKDIAAWNGATWQALGNGVAGNEPFSSAVVLALTVHSGALIAGGYFTIAGEGTVNSIARWNGSTWQPLGSGMGIEGPYVPNVCALTVYNGELVAGGWFTAAGGVAANNVARWDGSVWRPLGAGIGGSDSCVKALTVSNGALIAAGKFSTAGSVTAKNIARWDGSSWHALGDGLGGVGENTVLALAVCNNEVIAGGRFTTTGALNVNCIARWDGLMWHSLDGGVGNSYRPFVTALTVYSNELIAGGNFTTAGGVAANYVARWNGSAWQPLGNGETQGLAVLTVYNDDLIAGGSFAIEGGVGGNRIARWNGSAWRPLGSGIGGVYYPSVQAMTVYNGDLIIGGAFTGIAGVVANRIARWDGSIWQSLGSGMSGDPEQTDCSVSALVVHNGTLIAGGNFTTAGGLTADSIARWDGYDWQPMGSGMAGYDSYTRVFALTEYRGDLIAAGCFLTADGGDVNHIARWDGSAWQPLAGGMSGSTEETFVHALIVYNDELIAGGEFEYAGDVKVNSIARWDGTTWCSLGTGVNTGLYDLAVFNGELVAGGWFTIAGGVTAEGIARWNGSVWQPLGGWTDNAYVLAVYNGELIVGGMFENGGSVGADYIARWNGLNWQSLGSGMNSRVDALTAYNGELIVGGDFTTAGGHVSAYLARWGTGPRADLDCDLDVDSADFDLFESCTSGPGINHNGSPLCQAADLDDDGDVDQTDIGLLQRCLSGADVPAEPDCPT